MLYKMLAIERTWQQSPGVGRKPRQVFITQSRVLAVKAEEHFTELMSSFIAIVYSPDELRTMGKDAEQEIEFVDQDDDNQWRSDLPERFSELSDQHFPLFITYDRVRMFGFSSIQPHHFVNSSVQCFRKTSGETTTTMASLSPTSMSSEMKRHPPQVQRRLGNLGCVRDPGVRHSGETLFPMENF